MRQKLQESLILNSECKTLPDALMEYKVIDCLWNTTNHCSCGAKLENCAVIENIFNKKVLYIGLECLNEYINPRIMSAKTFKCLTSFRKHMQTKPHTVKILKDTGVLDLLFEDGHINENTYKFYIGCINSNKNSFSERQSKWICDTNKIIFSYFRM